MTQNGIPKKPRKSRQQGPNVIFVERFQFVSANADNDELPTEVVLLMDVPGVKVPVALPIPSKEHAERLLDMINEVKRDAWPESRIIT